MSSIEIASKLGQKIVYAIGVNTTSFHESHLNQHFYAQVNSDFHAIKPGNARVNK